MHPSVNNVLQFFTFDHLPAHLKQVSQPFHELANVLANVLPPNPETTVCLRKLLEAKDAAVRSLLFKSPVQEAAESGFFPKRDT